MFVYIVHMCRWGDNENHSYVSSAYSTLKEALKEGLFHSEFRANKYEPMIYMLKVDGSTHNILCKNIDEARKLYEELKTDEVVSD